MLDLFVRGGTVMDRAGAFGEQRDVGVVDDELVTGDQLTSASAAQTRDAVGPVVCPRFVYTNAHCDLEMLRDPTHEHAVVRRVNCEALRQDGLPSASAPDLVVDDLRERWRNWHGSLTGGVTAWRSVVGYGPRRDVRIAANTGYLVPYGTLWLLVMRTEARSATAGELNAMCQLFRRELGEGASGLSAGLTYALAMFATEEELVELCEVVAEPDGFSSHRTTATTARAAEVDGERIDLARASALTVHLTHAHLGFPPNRDRAAELLAMVDARSRRGSPSRSTPIPASWARATCTRSYWPGCRPRASTCCCHGSPTRRPESGSGSTSRPTAATKPTVCLSTARRSSSAGSAEGATGTASARASGSPRRDRGVARPDPHHLRGGAGDVRPPTLTRGQGSGTSARPRSGLRRLRRRDTDAGSASRTRRGPQAEATRQASSSGSTSLLLDTSDA